MSPSGWAVGVPGDPDPRVHEALLEFEGCSSYQVRCCFGDISITLFQPWLCPSSPAWATKLKVIPSVRDPCPHPGPNSPPRALPGESRQPCPPPIPSPSFNSFSCRRDAAARSRIQNGAGAEAEWQQVWELGKPRCVFYRSRAEPQLRRFPGPLTSARRRAGQSRNLRNRTATGPTNSALPPRGPGVTHLPPLLPGYRRDPGAGGRAGGAAGAKAPLGAGWRSGVLDRKSVV